MQAEMLVNAEPAAKRIEARVGVTSEASTNLLSPPVRAGVLGEQILIEKGIDFATRVQTNDALAIWKGNFGPPSAVWRYCDSDGQPVGLVARWDKENEKIVRPVSRNGSGWTLTGMPEPRPLYRLPDLATANLVYVVEGEKCADAGWSLGMVTTTAAHGSKSPKKTDWTPLAGKLVAVLVDNDDEGREYGNSVVQILKGIDSETVVTIVQLPDLPPKGDIVDWVNAHGDAAEPDEMRRQIDMLVDTTDPWKPKALPGPAEGEEEIPTVLRPEGRTDAANAKRLVTKHGCDIHYIDPWKKWLIWDGQRWAIDQTRRIDALAKNVVGGLWLEVATAARNAGEKTIAAMMRFAKVSNNKNASLTWWPLPVANRTFQSYPIRWTPIRGCSTFTTGPSTFEPLRFVHTTGLITSRSWHLSLTMPMRIVHDGFNSLTKSLRAMQG